MPKLNEENAEKLEKALKKELEQVNLAKIIGHGQSQHVAYHHHSHAYSHHGLYAHDKSGSGTETW